MKIAKLGLVAILTAGALYAGNYNVDTAHSSVAFKVKHMMISNVSGKFNDISGNFEYDETTNTLKALSGEIIVASINKADKKREKNIKTEEIERKKKILGISETTMLSELTTEDIGQIAKRLRGKKVGSRKRIFIKQFKKKRRF